MQVIIDSREPNYIYEVAKKHLTDFEVVRHKLEIGDIQFNGVNIERKTPNDFINSVRRPRFWSNLQVARTNYTVAIVYLDGDTEDWMRAISRHGRNYSTIQGSIASIVLMGIPVVSFAKLDSAFRWFNLLFKKVANKKTPETAKLAYSKRRLNLHELRIKSIMAIPRIGNITAEKLLHKHKSIYNIIKAALEGDEPLDEIITEFYCVEE